ncbi:MAG: ATP:guanido phosphotransferase [Puniceicoccaceae bacterium 5H]|nr:MAG: ATP:guanido phosphotransferase [Puniceicoccaceae bacterium 5H]
MQITPLIAAKAELTSGGLPAEPIVLSTRVRLARNIVSFPFPGRANSSQREQVLHTCFEAMQDLHDFEDGHLLETLKLSPLEKQALVERHLISRELSQAEHAGGVAVSADQKVSVMVNEEDHLRLQLVRTGFNLDTTWNEINALDTEMEGKLDYAFSDQLGYLTACPTNLGTGLRASAMLHLPGLVMQEYMEKVVRMVNQLGMAVRGLFGEGSEATGSIFQISNQQTLGESEQDIIKRLSSILHAIIEQEQNARQVILEKKPARLFDKIGRAYGILQNGHLLSSEEAMNLLSLMRLAVDLGLLPEDYRTQVDRLFIEAQPGHVQLTAKGEIEPRERDKQRATRMREEFAQAPTLNYKNLSYPAG